MGMAPWFCVLGGSLGRAELVPVHSCSLPAPPPGQCSHLWKEDWGGRHKSVISPRAGFPTQTEQCQPWELGAILG